jgi:hypothetical protein
MSYKKKLPKRRSPKQNRRSPKQNRRSPKQNMRSPKQKKKKSPKQKKKKSPKQKKKSPKKRSRRRFSMKSNVINVVNDILKNQELRLKLYKIYSKYSEKTATFRMMGRIGEISQNIYLRMIDIFVGNNLPDERSINFIMDYVDVGVRINGQQRSSYSTLIINLLIFSISLTQDNQYYMMTPMFMSIISNFINNPGENDAFFNILLSARINGGLNPEDVLYDIQTTGVSILNPEQYEGWNTTVVENINRIGNRAVYTAITQALSLYRRRVLN